MVHSANGKDEAWYRFSSEGLVFAAFPNKIELLTIDAQGPGLSTVAELDTGPHYPQRHEFVSSRSNCRRHRRSRLANKGHLSGKSRACMLPSRFTKGRQFQGSSSIGVKVNPRGLALGVREERVMRFRSSWSWLRFDDAYLIDAKNQQGDEVRGLVYFVFRHSD